MSDGPTLFCYDGSEGSRAALAAAASRLRPGPAIVLTVWETVALRVAAQGFGGGMTVANEADLDAHVEAAARAAAEEGARAATEHGWVAEARLEPVTTTAWRKIIEVAEEVDAGLIVCGTRGLGGLRGMVLGSVSRAVLQHAKRPVLVAPVPGED